MAFEAFNPREQTDARLQMVRIKWLHYIVVGSSIEAGDFIVQGRQRGQEHHGKVMEKSTSAYIAAEIKTILAADNDLGDKHIGDKRLKTGLCLGHGGDAAHSKSTTQDLSNLLLRMKVVVDEQNI